MKKVFTIKFSVILVLMIILSGCATNRGIVRLDVPSSGSTDTQLNGKMVVIESVKDNRQFQEDPKTQDIPSLGFGGAASATDEIKKRAIGRKRNGFGKALGDILLEEGQTVETVIENALKTAFSEQGYRVVQEKSKTADTITVVASIEKFWAYMTPGFWAITLSSDISTDVVLKIPENGKVEEKIITVRSEGKYQTGIEENWMEVVHGAIQKYIDALKKEL
ncbi:MAG: hypothetical protein RQ739_13480 [Desulfotignum sp.]|nr:hypothetical protein [Desulfotignum sp.]